MLAPEQDLIVPLGFVIEGLEELQAERDLRGGEDAVGTEIRRKSESSLGRLPVELVLLVQPFHRGRERNCLGIQIVLRRSDLGLRCIRRKYGKVLGERPAEPAQDPRNRTCLHRVNLRRELPKIQRALDLGWSEWVAGLQQCMDETLVGWCGAAKRWSGRRGLSAEDRRTATGRRAANCHNGFVPAGRGQAAEVDRPRLGRPLLPEVRALLIERDADHRWRWRGQLAHTIADVERVAHQAEIPCLRARLGVARRVRGVPRISRGDE